MKHFDHACLCSVPIKRRYIRNPNEQEFNEGKMLIFRGTEDQHDEKAFVPVEIKAGKNKDSFLNLSKFILSLGDAIIIHGQAVHKSEQSRSKKVISDMFIRWICLDTSPISRQIYTFHIIEMNNSDYSKENW